MLLVIRLVIIVATVMVDQVQQIWEVVRMDQAQATAEANDEDTMDML